MSGFGVSGEDAHEFVTGDGFLFEEVGVVDSFKCHHVIFVTHAVAGDHRTGKAGGLLNVVGGAGGDPAEEDLLCCAASGQGNDAVEEVLAGHEHLLTAVHLVDEGAVVGGNDALAVHLGKDQPVEYQDSPEGCTFSESDTYLCNVMEQRYFFRPRVGKDYQDGFMGLRTLVLGAYHYCWYDKCRYFNDCVKEGRAADYDTVCPEYEQMSDRDYYRLSNSNVIEIDSYLEGEHYPAYDSFTHRMLGKKSYLGSEARASFWERVAFYNWIQHYLPGPVEDFSYERWEPVFMQDLPSFEDVLRELRPQAVLVWTEPLRQFLDRHCTSLEGISLVRTGVIEMEALEAWEYRVGYEGEPQSESLWPDYRDYVKSMEHIVSGEISQDSLIERILETLSRIRRHEYSGGEFERRVCSIRNDSDLIISLTEILQKRLGVDRILRQQKCNLEQSVSGVGRVYCNFYYCSTDKKDVVPLTGIYAAGSGRPSLLALWEENSSISINDIGRRLSSSDAVLVYIDDNAGVPFSVLAELFEAVLVKAAKALFLMRKTDNNDRYYRDAFKGSGMLSKVAENGESILIELKPGCGEKVVMVKGNRSTVRDLKSITSLFPSNMRMSIVQRRTFEKIIRGSILYPRLDTGNGKAIEEMANILRKAYEKGLIEVCKSEEDSKKSRETIYCIGRESETLQLIDQIRTGVHIPGKKRGLEIGEVLEFLHTDIKNVAQKLHKMRTR